ncbi:MAG TPA: BT_3928 family protein [Chitinophagaceae bacterium]|nr:BT_3928 family protein [Chitinophagaceae bacterium]
MKYILWLLRIIVGALFIFSGLIKANDPQGLSYKMNEFFEVWGMHGLMEYSLALSVLMIGFEIIAGIALLLGAAFRAFSFLLLLLNVFFTFLTAYVYLTDKIKECGCFGDCIKISNAETFWKDVILLALVIILFVFRKRIKPVFNGKATFVLMTLAVLFAFGSQWKTLNYLPVFDCLSYKVGTHIWTKMQAPPGSTPDVYKTVMIYAKDGKQQEFDETNYPWQDTTWVFVDSKSILVKKGNAEPAIKDFVLSDYSGNDLTESILKEPGYTFFLFIRDVKKASTENIERLQTLVSKANQLNVPFYILSSSSKSDADAFAAAHKLQGAQWMIIDVTVSKTAMRSNPGLMMLKDGVIQNKWSPKTYPKDMAMNGAVLNLQ